MYGKPGERDVNELYQQKIKEFSKKWTKEYFNSWNNL
jgi:hypothetical protein